MILWCETDVKFIKQSLTTRVAERVSLNQKGVARDEIFFSGALLFCFIELHFFA